VVEGRAGGGLGERRGRAHTDAYLRFRPGVVPLLGSVPLLVLVVVVPGALACAVVVLSGGSRGRGKAPGQRYCKQFSWPHSPTLTHATGRAGAGARAHYCCGGGGAAAGGGAASSSTKEPQEQADKQASRSPPILTKIVNLPTPLALPRQSTPAAARGPRPLVVVVVVLLLVVVVQW